MTTPSFVNPVHSLSALIQTPINEAIPAQTLSDLLSNSPFIPVPGTFNLRDIAHPAYIRSGLVYRSGSLIGLTAEGKDFLVNGLEITTIFDLRSARERQMFPSPALEAAVDGIEVMWSPPNLSPADVDISDFSTLDSDQGLWDGGSRGFSKSYIDVLSVYKTAFSQVFRHLLSKPGAPILFNCTVGKDRTGVLAALILAPAGVPDEGIAFDYALSRLGIESRKEFLTAIVKKWKPSWNEDTPGISGFSNVRSEYMRKFLEDAREIYTIDGKPDWAETYVCRELGLLKPKCRRFANTCDQYLNECIDTEAESMVSRCSLVIDKASFCSIHHSSSQLKALLNVGEAYLS